MPVCEKCMAKAILRAKVTNTGYYQHYLDILCEIAESGILCSRQEQAGQFWDEEREIDIRKESKNK